MCRRRRCRYAFSGAETRKKSTLDIVRTRRRAAPGRIAPTSSAARRNLKAVAGTHLDAGFLCADHARRKAGGMQNVIMRRAIGAAQNPAGAMACAVTCRIGERRLLGLDNEREQPARSATKCAIAAGIRAELVAREEQRKSRLGYFQAAELDAAGRMPLARAGPAVAHWRGAAARSRLKHVPDEASVRTRIAALDGDAEAPAPTRHGAVRTGGSQRLDHRLDDLIAAVAGAQSHRGTSVGPHHGARFGDNLERPESAVVLRRVRINQVGERGGNASAHVSV